MLEVKLFLEFYCIKLWFDSLFRFVCIRSELLVARYKVSCLATADQMLCEYVVGVNTNEVVFASYYLLVLAGHKYVLSTVQNSLVVP